MKSLPKNPLVLKPHHAVKVLGSNEQSIRVRMQEGSFDPSIGTIRKSRKDGGRYTYDIYPEKLANYLHITVDDVFERLAD